MFMVLRTKRLIYVLFKLILFNYFHKFLDSNFKNNIVKYIFPALENHTTCNENAIINSKTFYFVNKKYLFLFLINEEYKNLKSFYPFLTKADQLNYFDITFFECDPHKLITFFGAFKKTASKFSLLKSIYLQGNNNLCHINEYLIIFVFFKDIFKSHHFRFFYSSLISDNIENKVFINSFLQYIDNDNDFPLELKVDIFKITSKKINNNLDYQVKFIALHLKNNLYDLSHIKKLKKINQIKPSRVLYNLIFDYQNIVSKKKLYKDLPYFNLSYLNREVQIQILREMFDNQYKNLPTSFNVLDCVCYYSQFEYKLAKKDLDDLNVLKNMQGNFLLFLDYLNQHSNSIAFIGNSPVELGKSNGAKIDSFQKVVRFNNYSIEDHFIKDYGSKVNVWVTAQTDDVIHRSDEEVHSYDFIVVSGLSSSPIRIMDQIKRFQRLSTPVVMIPSDVIEELIAISNTFPSAGLTLLYFFNTRIKSINLNNIFGFSMKDRINEKKHFYYTKEEQPLFSQHAWDREWITFNRIIKNEL